MSPRRLRPSRLAAAAALAVAGTIAAGALTPAHADCVAFSAYVYKNRQGRQYIGGQPNCVYPTGWNTGYHNSKSVEQDTTLVPAGVPTGAGVAVWVPLP